MICFPQLYIVQMWCYECPLHCANCVQLLCVLCHSDVEADIQGEELLPSLKQGEAAPHRGHGGGGLRLREDQRRAQTAKDKHEESAGESLVILSSWALIISSQGQNISNGARNGGFNKKTNWTSASATAALATTTS